MGIASYGTTSFVPFETIWAKRCLLLDKEDRDSMRKRLRNKLEHSATGRRIQYYLPETEEFLE